MVFPVVIFSCESWTIKKADHQRNDAFELCCWRRLLKVPWTARSNWSILRDINPEYSLERLMLKLKLQYFGHLMWTSNSLEKTLMLGKIEGSRRKGCQRMRWLDGNVIHWAWCNEHELGQTLGDGEGQGDLARCSPWVAKSQAQLGNWTATYV